MRKLKHYTRRATALTAMTAAGALALSGVAYADNIQDNIVDNTAGITLTAGSTTTGSANIRVIGNGADGGASLPGCNVSATSAPLVLDIVTPLGVTATPSRLSISACGTDYPVSFRAGSSTGYANAVVDFVSGPGGIGAYNNQVRIPITVSAPANTKPSVAVSGVTNGAGYEIGAVPTAMCNVTDAEDGPSSFAAAMSGVLTNGLGSRTATCNYTDRGGLLADTKTATYSVVDTGSPTIGHSLSGGTKNVNGWYNADVAVSFSCADAGGSGIASCVGDTTLGQGTDQSVTGTATDHAGNQATDTVSGINIDTTPPTITARQSGGSLNGRGWYNQNVTVSFDCADTGGSGVDTCSPTVIVGQGAAQSVTGTVTDKAGNSASASVRDLSIDTTKPSIRHSLTGPTPSTHGWYDDDVAVSFTCEDDLSGVHSCVGDTTLGEGADQSATGTATDLAGNSATDTASGVKVDKTAPSISHRLSGAVRNSNGWYKANVTVSFDCDDALSGVDTCVGSDTLGEGADQSRIGTATDLAGNAAGDRASGINIDKTAPSVGFVGGPGATVYFGDAIAAPGCDGSDSLSGMASCVVTGGGTALGTHSYTATATDRAGNVASTTRSYDVLGWSNTGYTSPVDMKMWNSVKGGSTVPMKYKVFAGSTELTSTSKVVGLVAKVVNCPGANALVDPIEETVIGSTSLKYDVTGGQFHQNWQTPKKPGTCYAATTTLQDGSTISANFILK